MRRKLKNYDKEPSKNEKVKNFLLKSAPVLKNHESGSAFVLRSWIRVLIRFVLRGWIRIRLISDRIGNPVWSLLLRREARSTYYLAHATVVACWARLSLFGALTCSIGVCLDINNLFLYQYNNNRKVSHIYSFEHLHKSKALKKIYPFLNCHPISTEVCVCV